MLNVSKKGIALISILLIMVILVMFISAFGTIVTGSQTFAANNATRVMLGQIAEAGIAYVTYKLNENPAWAENGEHTLNDIKGKFYITFNPSEDYCSINNLTKIISAARNTEPAGTVVPPYTAEIIIKATVMDQNNRNKLSKYYTVQLVRGDFFDKHVSSEGPILIDDPKLYMDPGTKDKGGQIQSNYVDDEIPSISFITSGHNMEVSMGHIDPESKGYIKGVISTPGIINRPLSVNFDADTTSSIQGSSKLPQGYLDIKDMIARGTGTSSSIEILKPGVYTVNREALYEDSKEASDKKTFTGYAYSMTYPDGSIHERDEWFDIDLDSGDVIIKKDILVNPEGSVRNFNITFGNYNNRRTQENSVPANIAAADFPAIPVIEGDEVIEASTGDITSTGTGAGLTGEYVTGNNGMTQIHEEDISYANPLIRLGPVDTLDMINGTGGGNDNGVKISQGSGGPGTGDPEFTTIYSNCNTSFDGQIIGTGTILCDGTLSAKLDKNYGALALLSTDDLTINISSIEQETIHFYGLLYSQDDVIMKPPIDITSAPVGKLPQQPRPNMGVAIYSGDMNKSDDLTIGGAYPVSIKLRLPKKDVLFRNYNGYTRLLEEATGYNYSFPVKVKCYYEM